MRTLVIKSKKETQGYQKEWSILGSFFTEVNGVDFFMKLINRFNLSSVDEAIEVKTAVKDRQFDFMGYTYYLVNQSMFQHNFFNGGVNGFASKEIINFFNQKTISLRIQTNR